jgi:hypothetical protein
VLAGPTATTGHDRALVDLSQWVARTLQYSAKHPACRQLAERTHATMTLALAEASPLVVGVLKDDVLVGGVSSRHPAIRTRIGPCLHERGVMVLRLLHGVTLAELTSLVEILTLPAQTVFDRGGVLRIAMDAGLARVQVEELAHDVTAEEREAQRRRAKLRSFFKEILLSLLARRVVDERIAAHLVELLEHPDIAVMILEEDPAMLAEAAAGLALVTRQEEKRSGLALADKLRVVLLVLSPRSRDRLVLGFPTLVDELRAALAWAFDGFTEPELARMAGPAVRAHASELDVVLYALSAAVPHEGTRMSALRWLGMSFFDWPADDAPGGEALVAIAEPVAEYASFRPERLVLGAAAEQVLAARGVLARIAPAQPAGSIPPEPDDEENAVRAFDGRRPVAEVIGIATRTRSFDRFCEGLPAAADALLGDGSTSGVIGILRGLAGVTVPAWREATATALSRVAAASAPRVLGDLDQESSTLEGSALEELAQVARLLAAVAPAAVLDRLDASENRKMRRILLDALPQTGPAVLPLVRTRLQSDRWYVVRNAVLLLARIGGTARDLEAVHRHPDDRVRIEVVRSLRAMPPDESTMSLVVRCLSDLAAEVRQNACLLLRGEVLGEGAIAELARIAAADARPDDVRTAAVEALGRSPRDAAAQALFDLLHPQGLLESGATSSVRDQSAAALRRSPAAAAADLFARGMASSSRRVRKACERATGVRG